MRQTPYGGVRINRAAAVFGGFVQEGNRMENFGETIKTLRKSSDLTQTQFAEKLGVHLQTISKWERGLLVPDFSLLGEIASALSVSLETLLGMPQGEETFTGAFDMASFGKVLAEARKKKNESQSELAEALGVSTDNISKWERGITCPDAVVLVSLAEHFEMPASKLYFGILDETEVETPAQWRRRKRLHILWLVCAVLPLCVIVVVLSVLLAVLPRTEVERTEFAINYWLCGGAFRAEAPDVIREEDGEVTLAIPEKAGSEFLGWYLSPDYSGERVQTVVCEGEDITVYAKWSDLTYEIRYELGGGILAENYPSLVTAKETHVLFDPVRKGYLFLGWFTSPENGERYESVGGENAGNLTLYAVWQKCDTKFAVRYELGGGALNGENPDFVGAGEIHPLNAPEKRGHTFLGWNKAPDGSGEYVSVLYGISEDLTLYAVYAPKTYLVRYVYDGFYPGEEVNPNRVGFGERVELLPVERYGSVFLGWYNEETGGKKIDVLDESNLPETSVLYARFEPLRYSIELDADGGSFLMDGAEVSAYTLDLPYGETYPLPVPRRNDDIFLGWENENGETVEEIGQHNICDMKLRAHWRPRELRYQIRYELCDGIQNDENPTEGISGQRVYLHDPQRTGYLFLGWYDNAEGQGERYEYIPEDRETDIVLYALWQEIITAGSSDYFTYEKGANAVKITGYTGPSGDNVDLSFPAIIDGLPVTEIMREEWRYDSILFHSVTIPDSVTVLGKNAFQKVTAAQPLMIPAKVQRIEQYCFQDYGGRVCFSGHGDLTYIGANAFYNVVFGETLVLPEGITTIENGAFGSIDADGVILPDSVKSVGVLAFQHVSADGSRRNIFLPASVAYVAARAFMGCNVYTALTEEQTKEFDPDWAQYASWYTAEKHKVTLSDGGYTESFENDYVVLPKRKKEGFTFLGWKNEEGNFVSNCYFPQNDETLVAAYEEETPTDGRAKERAIPLTAGQNDRLTYVSMQYVYFVWEGEECTLQFNLSVSLTTCLLRGGEETRFYRTCACKKGDLFRIGGDWAQAGTVLTVTVTVV